MWSLSSLAFSLTLQVAFFTFKAHGGFWQKSYLDRVERADAIDAVERSRGNIACRYQRWMRISRCGASCAVPGQSIIGSSNRDGQVPKLFHDGDEIYDRYAACLAATEGLRRIRDETIEGSVLAQRKGNSHSKKYMREAKDLAFASYVENASKIVQSMGMPVAKFNDIGRKVCKDSQLKEKVLEQATLYRIHSAVHWDPVLKEAKAPLTESFISKFDQFCQSVEKIEHLRRAQAEQLKRALRMDQLSLPLEANDVSPIQSAMEEFAATAHQVVRQHGLEASDFNQLLERMKRNPFFRGKVLRRLGSLQKQRELL